MSEQITTTLWPGQDIHFPTGRIAPRRQWMECRARNLAQAIHERMQQSAGAHDIELVQWVAELSEIVESPHYNKPC